MSYSPIPLSSCCSLDICTLGFGGKTEHLGYRPRLDAAGDTLQRNP